MKVVKVLFLLAVVAYLVSVFGFEHDPLKLIIKKPAAAQARKKPLTPREALVEYARQYIRPGRTMAEIEARFGTRARRLGEIYKRTMLVGETKYAQYSIYLGEGITAYVLCETFAARVADHNEPVLFNKSH